MDLNSPYIKYGIIAVVAIVILYALMKGGSSTTSSTPSGGAIGVDVNYRAEASQSDSAELAARASAFSEIAGLFGLAISEESELEQSRMAHGTARRIAAGEEATARLLAETELEAREIEADTLRYGLDVGRQVEALRLRGQREMAEFQAGQVNYLAESFRKTDLKRQSTVLNALTSIWGAAPVYAPQGSTASGILGGIANVARSVFGPLGF